MSMFLRLLGAVLIGLSVAINTMKVWVPGMPHVSDPARSAMCILGAVLIWQGYALRRKKRQGEPDASG